MIAATQHIDAQGMVIYGSSEVSNLSIQQGECISEETITLLTLIYRANSTKDIIAMLP